MRRKRTRVALVMAAGIFPALAFADTLDEARAALRESIPQVAAAKAELVLAEPRLSDDRKSAATLLQAEALYEMRQYEEALTQLRPLLTKGDTSAALLQAHIFAAQGRWKEAQAAYHPLGVGPDAPIEAWIGEAEALYALDRPADALTLFQAASRKAGAPPLLELRIAALQIEMGNTPKAQATLTNVKPNTPEEQKWKEYVEARLLLARDQAAPALTLFEEVVRGRENLPESLYVAATFGATDARVLLYGTEEADRVLETFIWRHSASSYLDRGFHRLDQIYAQEENAPESEYNRWAGKNQPRRSALAKFYVAKLQARQNKIERAIDSLDLFIRGNPEHPLIGEAYLLYADLLSRQGNFEEAARALDGAMRHAEDAETRAEIELRSGLIHYQQNEFLLAATQFDAAARRSETVRPVATFDTALAWLAQRNFEQFRAPFEAFEKLQPASPLRPELALEEGLTLARSDDPRARPTLEAFLKQYPQSPRAAEARLALAELSLFSSETQAGTPHAREVAAKYIRTVATAAPAPEVAAQADFLAIWLADTQEPRDDEKVIALARAFLIKHAGTSWVPQAEMKLGQLYFNREDYANAETYFTRLAQEAPDSPLAESALFLAGQSAAKLMNKGAIDRALACFDAVVKRDGQLKLYARQEQANIQGRLSREDEALALYDLILTATPPPDAQLRQASLCGKGDCLLTLGRRESSKERTTAAIAAYDELAAQPEVTPVWRNQALFKRGKALEQLGRTDEAVLSYYDVINRSTAGDREYFWLYKAAFEAARLFEQQEQWKSAAGIYEKVAAFEGPRSAEARTHLKQLRLEHYLWE